jgi:hypothetical protein
MLQWGTDEVIPQISYKRLPSVAASCLLLLVKCWLVCLLAAGASGGVVCGDLDGSDAGAQPPGPAPACCPSAGHLLGLPLRNLLDSAGAAGFQGPLSKWDVQGSYLQRRQVLDTEIFSVRLGTYVNERIQSEEIRRSKKGQQRESISFFCFGMYIALPVEPEEPSKDVFRGTCLARQPAAESSCFFWVCLD